MQKSNFYLLCSVLFVVSSLSLNGMFVSAALAKRMRKAPTTSAKRNASFVPLQSNPKKLVRLPFELTAGDLQNSSHIILQVNIPGYYGLEPRIIKLDHLSEKEQQYAQAHVNSVTTFDAAELIHII